MGEGFKPEDIEFAAEWTLKNAKEKPYDFSIICHTIGEAMAAKEKAEGENRRKIEQQKLDENKAPFRRDFQPVT